MKTDKFFGIITFIAILAFTLTACDEFETLFKETHKHKWNVFTEPSTCSWKGTEYKMCVECGEMTQSAIPIDPSNHISWYFDQTAKPTCATPGKGRETCLDCNAKREVDVPAWEHSWGNFSETLEPTCTTPGRGKETCRECNAEKPEEFVIPELGHSWGSLTEAVVGPTCTTSGRGKEICWRCDTENQVEIVIPELGHSWGTRVRTAEPTCTTLGKEEEPCIRGDCINEYHIPKLEHDRQIKRTIVESTCTTTGIAEESCLRKGCAEPNVTELVLPELGHSLSIRTLEYPTCATFGKERETCTRKGCTLPARDVTTPKSPHNIVKNYELIWSHCTSDQTVTETCTGCNYKRTYINYKTGHSWEYLPGTGMPPRKCRDCGLIQLIYF
jgi:hypothetical protein